MALILIHTIILVNDHVIENNLSYLNGGKNKLRGLDNNDDGEEIWKLGFHQDRDLNNLVNNIVFRYLMRDSKLVLPTKSYDFASKNTKEYINDIFLMISDLNYDLLNISKTIVDESILNYYFKSAANIDQIR